MDKTYVTQRGQTKRRATKRGGKGKKNKAVRGMSAALPVAPSPATIVFSAKLALGTHAPRFLFFLLTSVFLGCASPPIASSALPPPSSQIYTTGGKYQSKSFVQWGGPPPRQGRRGRRLWLSEGEQRPRRQKALYARSGPVPMHMWAPRPRGMRRGDWSDSERRPGTGARWDRGGAWPRAGGPGAERSRAGSRRDARAGGDQHNAHMTEAQRQQQ